MKANAPEKIYIEVTPDGTRYYRDVVKEQRTENSDIEYTRTDAFIERACEYILTHIPDMHILGDSCKMDECIIEDFRKYMEGE